MVSPASRSASAIEPKDSNFLLIGHELPKLDCTLLIEDMRVRFSISPEGRVVNIDTVSVQNRRNANVVQSTLSAWLFKPRVKGGLSVQTNGVVVAFKCSENGVSYQIVY